VEVVRLRQRHVRVERVGAADADGVAGVDRDVHVKGVDARMGGRHRRWGRAG